MRRLPLLIVCQALLFITNSTLIAVNGLVGLAIAPSSSLATLPITAYVIGGAIATTPVAMLMKSRGRRVGFSLGAAFGVAGAAICAYATMAHAFWLLCFGTLVGGVYSATGQLYRFAATEIVEPANKERAISFVLAGGLVGGVFGPLLSKYSVKWFSVPFVGAYAALIAFGVIALATIQWLRFPTAGEETVGGQERDLAEIMTRPVFVVAAFSAMVSYGVMNLLMTATPLAMKMCNHPYDDAATVLEWHVVGMFLPSFFTGTLIKRFGVLTIMATGALMMLACAAIALTGIDVSTFTVSLTLLGVGWNFLFIGATTLLTRAYSPAEKNKTQGANEFLVFITMATSSFSSGLLVTSSGWNTLNVAAVPFLVLVLASLAWLGRRSVTMEPTAR